MQKPISKPASGPETTAQVPQPPETIVSFPTDDLIRALQFVIESMKQRLDLDRNQPQGRHMMFEQFQRLVEAVRTRKDNETIAREFEAFYILVCDLDQAALDLLEGLRLEVAELWEALESKPLNPKEDNAKVLAEIDAELKRRSIEHQRVGIIQESLQDERDELRTRLEQNQLLQSAGLTTDESKLSREIAELERQRSSLEATIASIVAARERNSERVRFLMRYTDAIKMIDAGIPAGLIGEQLLPDPPVK